MIGDQKEKAIAVWCNIRMGVEEQFGALVMMAGELKRSGMIDSGGLGELEEVSAFCAHAIDDLGAENKEAMKKPGA